MDCTHPCAAQRVAWPNRSLKCGNLQYKWIVLICRVERCTVAKMTFCEILFVTLCSLSLSNQLHFSMSILVFIPSLSTSAFFFFFTSLSFSLSQFICPTSLLLISLQHKCFEPKNETGSVSAGGCWWCSNLPSFLQQSPPCSHLLLPPVIHNLHSALKS